MHYNIEQLRLIIFISLLLLLITFEFLFSWRKREIPRSKRWQGNALLVLIDSITVKVLFPIGATGVALWGRKNGYGLNLGIFSSIIALDFFIYFQHVLSHKIKFLWRFHYVHHSDPDLDVSSALRFHPVEIVLSMFYKFFLILVLGVNPVGVIWFEIILNSTAMFNHSNIYLPKKFERVLRYFIVTPQMHLIHHSIKKNESDTNYGFNISFWDRLFKTYLADFYNEITIGQKNDRSEDDLKIKSLLIQPFIKRVK